MRTLVSQIVLKSRTVIPILFRAQVRGSSADCGESRRSTECAWLYASAEVYDKMLGFTYLPFPVEIHASIVRQASPIIDQCYLLMMSGLRSMRQQIGRLIKNYQYVSYVDHYHKVVDIILAEPFSVGAEMKLFQLIFDENHMGTFPTSKSCKWAFEWMKVTGIFSKKVKIFIKLTLIIKTLRGLPWSDLFLI